MDSKHSLLFFMLVDVNLQKAVDKFRTLINYNLSLPHAKLFIAVTCWGLGSYPKVFFTIDLIVSSIAANAQECSNLIGTSEF